MDWGNLILYVLIITILPRIVAFIYINMVLRRDDKKTRKGI